MPVARTSGHHQVSGVTPTLTSPKPTTRSSSSSKRKRDTRPKPKPVILGEIIEISSDDDDEPTTLQGDSIVVGLRRQVKKLKEESSCSKTELATLCGELASARKEIVELKASSGTGSGKLDILQFDDNISCEVCTSRMWSPFILPECGHTFCLSCLQDWFGITLSQFIVIHPDYHDQQTHNYRLWEAMMQNPLILRTPYAAAYYAQLRQQAPRPQYTCPTCREPVKNRPVEDFALKTLIRAVATAAGEDSPKKSEKQVRGKATTLKTDLWDKFFPKMT